VIFDFVFFLKGVLIGMAMAAPVGPIAILTIHRSVVHGPLAGFIGGIGAALADGLFGTLAAFGHAAAAGFLETHVGILRTVGAALLLFMAARTYRRPIDSALNTEPASPHGFKDAAGDLVSTFFLTLTNPATLFAFMVVFAAVGIEPEEMGGNGPALMVVCGVLAGSLAWWGILSLGIGLFRRKMTPRALRIVNLASAAVLAALAVLVLAWQFYSAMSK
jgi:threonine/homoserine/homoserine lactone efflux protein